MTYPTDVAEFHRKFDLPTAGDGPPAFPAALDADDAAVTAAALAHLRAARDLLRSRSQVELYRAAFALEEKVELLEAIRDRDLPGVADALVDSVYVDVGTSHFYRLPFDAVWREVQRANLEKERGPTAARGHALDVRKPPGWRPPDVRGELRRAGWWVNE